MNPVQFPLALNKEYASFEALKTACREAAILGNFEYATVKSDKRRYTIKCKRDQCPWRLHASLIPKSTMVCIRSFVNDHQCVTPIFERGHSQATQAAIASKIIEKLHDQPTYRPKDIVQDMQRELGIQIHYKKALRAKDVAMAEINGSFEDAYKQLPQYCEDLKKSNPFTTAIVDSTSEGRFNRMFVSFGASAKGFRFCRPILGLDGTHLKNKYQGILLAAMAVDALGSLFPIAHAVVIAEDDDNWFWFLQQLRQIVQDHANQFLELNALTLLFDHQKGLIDGVAHVFPNSPHSYCLRHLEANFYKEFKYPSSNQYSGKLHERYLRRSSTKRCRR